MKTEVFVQEFRENTTADEKEFLCVVVVVVVGGGGCFKNHFR